MMTEQKKMYKKIASFLAAVALILLAGTVLYRATGHYPQIDGPASYEVNDVPGVTMQIKKVRFSPSEGWRGHCSVDSYTSEMYTPVGGKRLDRLVDGQWYRLRCERDDCPTFGDSYWIGGNCLGFEGEFTQQSCGYGTRLERGDYRLILELTEKDGSIHYLADEFAVR